MKLLSNYENKRKKKLLSHKNIHKINSKVQKMKKELFKNQYG